MKKKLCCVVLTLLAVSISGCQKTVSISYIDPDDLYTGWFKIDTPPSKHKSPDTIIPIFKIDGTYYSVCRGFEIPFKQTPQGLQWDLKSSMTGTTIGRYPDGTDFIIIRDALSEDFTSESEFPHDTSPRPMVRINKPSWLLDPTASPPKSNDDYLGTYQPVWFPYYRIEIYKEGKKYCERYYELDQQHNWSLQKENLELTVQTGGLGFEYAHRKNRNALIYNESLKRFEIVKQHTNPEIRMPLVRIPSDSEDKYTTPFNAIGIPSWH